MWRRGEEWNRWREGRETYAERRGGTEGVPTHILHERVRRRHKGVPDAAEGSFLDVVRPARPAQAD
jgi:hypothetical protein